MAVRIYQCQFKNSCDKSLLASKVKSGLPMSNASVAYFKSLLSLHATNKKTLEILSELNFLQSKQQGTLL